MTTKKGMNMPDVASHSKTRYTNRYDRPFCRANRADYNAFRALGCEICGYKGAAVVLNTPKDHRRPASLITSSRRIFSASLAVSTRSCWNCSTEKRGMTGFVKHRKPTLFVHGVVAPLQG